ncbi:hypothetical protein OG2516_11941 [Oceanicola granulosus HTCC2516]|uniref:YjbH domain-containing protein n=1 Tax=Oceanicola granulosus (strain ATCC BAA-861 / DSM 15982 / KCTC 12143 / HTCC2516) TaxID=314256 RepID=Q2CBD6_OCEGH|nr:YjbH domain-containing protein [Oceanicola granulosus]EAR49962.1 hypothetical protein OG2516_11941 [Oceanicola granulosus HTCC2516]
MNLKTTTILAGLALASPALAQSDWQPSYTLFGTPGLIDMPTGLSEPEGQISASVSGYDDQQRFTLSFQVTPRISGSFRYSRIEEFFGVGRPTTYDRSFDVRFRLLDEGRYVPALTLGLQDFLGTGRYSGEYLAATKHLSDNLRVTAGLGWGRFATEGGFDNPLAVFSDELENRPVANEAFYKQGGQISDGLFFRGPAALFGGVEYRFSDNFTGTVEYSSDGYERETAGGTFDHETPFNFGLTWQPRPEYALQLAYLNGSTLGFGATFTINANERPTYGGREPAPLPVSARAAGAAAAATWNRSIVPEELIRSGVTTALESEGQIVQGIELQDRTIRVRYENTRYRAEAQAMGRVSRILTAALPPSIENFTLEPVRNGIPLSSVTVRRSDLERYENEVGGSDAIFANTVFRDAAGTNAGLVEVPDPRPRFEWGIGPYFGQRLFDIAQPVALEVGVQASADYRIRPNLILSGSVRKRVLGNRDDADSVAESNLPQVRTDSAEYIRQGDPSLSRLTLAHYGRPGQNLYSRVTVGYLETMFGGISTELLWKPVDSRLALGAEVNYAVKRDYDLGLGFRDYDVVTGHASAYYDLGSGFTGQLDVGRYLAGDYGATVTVNREFANGWRVGAYVTRTNVSAEDFGEGSFDKGLSVEIPIDWILGTPTMETSDNRISSLGRDGGARLNVDGRLYETVREGHVPVLEETWGRFLR